MRLQRFRAVITADPRGRAVIEVPFNPDETTVELAPEGPQRGDLADDIAAALAASPAPGAFSGPLAATDDGRRTRR